MTLAASRLPLACLLATLLSACMQTAGGPPGRGPGALPMAPRATAITSDSVPEVAGFSSAVKVGLSLYLSGQVALDSAAHIVGPGDLRLQARQSLDNLVRLVRAARGLPGDVVKLTVYVAGLGPESAETIRDVSAEVFMEQPAPAITIVGVESLPVPGLLVAIDGVAVLRGEFADRERVGSR
jgi:enamine deaminase RidA (YjgF/YER057c/UK114 family)